MQRQVVPLAVRLGHIASTNTLDDRRSCTVKTHQVAGRAPLSIEVETRRTHTVTAVEDKRIHAFGAIVGYSKTPLAIPVAVFASIVVV